jgi:dCMP deaminase
MNAHFLLEEAVKAKKNSDDPSCQVGCVFFKNGTIISSGTNTLPNRVNVTTNRQQRPQKYKWIEHAERNAIYKAAKQGLPLNGSSVASTLFPCADCARAIIQVGANRLITRKPPMNNARWGENFNIANKMFVEAGVKIIYIE